MMAQGEFIQVFSPLDIRNQDGRLLELFLGMPALPGFASYRSTGGFGDITFHHFAGSGFQIWYSKYAVKEATQFIARADLSVLELHIPFQQHFITKWDGYYDSIQREKQFDLSFAPFINTISTLQNDVEYSTFDIHYDRRYLERFSSYSFLAGFLQRIEQNKATNLIGHTRFITPGMLEIIHQILHFNLDPALAAMFYESQVLLMLTHVLDSLHPHSKPFSLNVYERESTLHARDLLQRDPGKVYNIRQIAQLTGLNESKLQYNFKQLFGTTIFDYHQTLRLNHARAMLMDTSLTIQAIALHCGYSDNANLTAAFKKKFGCTPETYRKKK